MAKTIAIIGASANREKYGNKAVQAYASQGYTVYPVNPRGGEIEGLETYASVLEIPGPVDRAALYVPPEAGLEVIEAIAQKGITEVYLNPGSDSEAMIRKAESLGLTVVVACSILAVGISPQNIK